MNLRYKALFTDHRKLTQSETLYIRMYHHLSEESEIPNCAKGKTESQHCTTCNYVRS